MTTMVRARFDGKVLIPEEPVDLPINRPLNQRVEPADTSPEPKTALQRLAEVARQLAPIPILRATARHDHYLYGTPKRDNP